MWQVAGLRDRDVKQVFGLVSTRKRDKGGNFIGVHLMIT